jgi:poly-gamma-glutamate synthesis protein (capsule biosynthesis protein)
MILFLGGDLMTGRGLDLVLPHPGAACLHEAYAHSAETYVQLAERAHGRIRRPLHFAEVWGDALLEIASQRPDARIVNLETSITSRDAPWPDKGIHYRMHPDNAPCITAADIDCCVLANNHVLDHGRDGLLDTLQTLRAAGVQTAGAGRTLAEAWRPAAMATPGDGRVLVFGFGTRDSGIPPDWAAGADRPGVNLLPDLSEETVARIAEAVAGVKRRGDVVVASIHWGDNWGYDVPAAHVRFAHGLVRAGVDVVHGHSSHHVRPIDTFEGKLIVYGCGELLDDYEGIGGYDEFRGDLVLLFFARVEPTTGRLAGLRLTPMQIRSFRLHRASGADAEWLAATINRESRPFGVRVARRDDDRIELRT